MASNLRRLLTVGALFLLALPMARTDEKEEMVPNPYYEFWSGFKKGSTAVLLERSKLSGEEGKLVLGGVEEKRLAYKLLEVGDKRVVVEVVVTEPDYFGLVQAAPTRHIYPAKVKKSH